MIESTCKMAVAQLPALRSQAWFSVYCNLVEVLMTLEPRGPRFIFALALQMIGPELLTHHFQLLMKLRVRKNWTQGLTHTRQVIYT